MRIVRGWMYLALTVTLETVATLSLRASEGFTVLLPSVVSILGYGVTVYALSQALRVLPMGLSYVVWTGVGTAAIVVCGIVLFGDVMTPPAWLGIALVVGGVAMINARRDVGEVPSGKGEEHAERSAAP